MNNFNFSGRLVRDPEAVESSKTDTTIAKFTVANDKYGKDKGTNFFRVTAFNKTADFITQYGKKGGGVNVSGRVEINEVGEGDERKTYIDIVANEVELTTRPKDQENE